MKKLMNIPFYIPFAGIIVSFALFITVAYSPSTALLIAGMILFHLCGWILAVKFFLGTIGFFGSIVGPK
jgi:hypothetical protein